ncbi:hypothetical protein GCM10023084_78260 [Streptomyces lacrimifluminis]|uniref:HTH merR-type domain-containing protein n=1 Tax=Streptomyces lacrimifluminis TaxID=1500077 RepID=A0A917UMQ5_9ACTN|nr:hypothetical protein GCM10012282_77040 [Streptomyces lacrimifluminis]
MPRLSGGYRLYDPGSVARLELIRTLRESGLGLDHVRAVPAGETTVEEVAATHVTAVDTQIRTPRVTRAVLSSVARRGSTAAEMTLMLCFLGDTPRPPGWRGCRPPNANASLRSSWTRCSTASTRRTR